jgi:aspartyl-tRNA(Asn)/glutamyl-tRNA(Gln) amidotransferase subunit A
MSTMKNLEWLTATELAPALRTGKLRSQDLMTAVLDRIRLLNPKINSFVEILSDAAMAEAILADKRQADGATLGPLHGVPVSIKDILYTKSVRTTAGSFAYKDFKPDADAIVVERLRAAGAIVIGKTTTPEFCHKTVTDSPLLGVTRNPWDLSKTTAGSSGGSAAAVAAGMGALSVGTDGGGSIRLPASLCGVVGFKPSAGAVPQYPGFAGWDFLGHTGPFARSVADVELAMSVIAGPDPRDPASLLTARPDKERTPLRVACAYTLSHLEPEADVVSAFRRAIKAAATLTPKVENVTINWTDPDLHFRVIVSTELASALAYLLPEYRDKLDPTLVKMIEFGMSQNAAALIAALSWKRDFTRKLLSFFDNYDILIVPTSPVTAFSAEIIGPTRIAGRKTSPYEWFGWTWPFNVSGFPALSLPVWADNVMPVGIQVVGRLGADELILKFGGDLEARLGAFRPPPSS